MVSKASIFPTIISGFKETVEDDRVFTLGHYRIPAFMLSILLLFPPGLVAEGGRPISWLTASLRQLWGFGQKLESRYARGLAPFFEALAWDTVGTQIGVEMA